MSSRRRVVGIVIALWSGGCAVGPDFVHPPAPTAGNYDVPRTEPPVPTAIATPTAADLPGQWWQLYRSQVLDQTLRTALAGSPTLESAQATLAAAREAVVVARAGYLPRVAASAGAEREQGTPANYSLGLTASYSFNAFGGATRRLVEQQQALADLQRYEVAGAYLTLTGGVVTQALAIALARLQVATTLELVSSDQRNLDLTRRKFEAGAAARTDVLTAESQLAADQATLPALRQQLSVARHALAVLVGRSPAEWSAPDFDVADFTRPPELPLSLPSQLVRQRPDILAAESQVHAASAAIGVAVAQQYPSITLTGGLTREALSASALFHDFERSWNAAGSLVQPLFQGGALRAQTRAARDLYAAQAASYRNVVLEAFGQVADELRALEHDADRVVAYHHALQVAGDALALQRASYAAGKTTVLQLIDAERTYAQARLGSATADVAELQDAAQLMVALGGGWWHEATVAAQ